MTILAAVKRTFSPRRLEQVAIKSRGPVDPSELERNRWPDSLLDPGAFYRKCFRYYQHQLPEPLKKHREYFAQNKRGFGEDAFHVMWHLLYREFAFKRFIEIGIYRGQVISLMSLMMQRAEGGEVVGISPFTPAADSVSHYLQDVDYMTDTLANFRAFDLPEPKLLKAYSTDVNAVELIRSQPWDCAYIDGNHDYDVAIVDWRNCAEAVRTGGIIVLDDSGLSSTYKAPRFATPGHPGPSRVASEIDPAAFAEILQVGHNRVFQKR